MDEGTTPGSGLPLRRWSIPWPVWLLLAGAIVQLGVHVAPDSYQVFGPYFLVSGEMVIDWIRSTTPFLLAAFVVLAANRWPAGRRLLLIGAAVMAAAAVLQMALDIWWAIWETAPGPLPDGTQPWLSGAFLGVGLAMVAAHALLAAGLWAARAPRPVGRIRVALIALIGMAGLVATGAGLWVVGLVFRYTGSVDYLWVSVAGAALTAAGFAALAAVAMAAVRTAQRPDRIPEILIAIGATVTMVATAWTWGFPHFAPIEAWSEGTSVWVFTIPNAVATLGMLAMIAGFGLGAIATYGGRRRAAGDPTA